MTWSFSSVSWLSEQNSTNDDFKSAYVLVYETDNAYAAYWTKCGLTICFDETDSQNLGVASDMWMGDMVHNGTVKTYD